jgi:hypothetical protein
VENGTVFCRGIVFRLADHPQGARPALRAGE